MTSRSFESNYTNTSSPQWSTSSERIQFISSKIDIAPLPAMDFKLMTQAPKLPCRQVSVDEQSKKQTQPLSLPFQRSEPTPMNFKLMAHAPKLPCRQVSVDPPKMPMKQALSASSDRRRSCPERELPPLTEIFIPSDCQPSQITVDPKVVMIDHDSKDECFKDIATKLKSIPRPPKLPSRQVTEECAVESV